MQDVPIDLGSASHELHTELFGGALGVVPWVILADSRGHLARFEGESMKFRTVALIAGLLVAGYSTVFLINSNLTTAKAQVVPAKIVNDQVAEYNVAVKAGSKTDRCVQAGFVASAYNQTRDEANYQKWVNIRQQECQAAGLPQ
jgi:hypothetical protein